jgi:hypothetical protein
VRCGVPNDDFRRNAKQYREAYLSWNLLLADLLTQIGKRHGVVACVAAIAWTLHHPAITAAIVGGRSAEQSMGSYLLENSVCPRQNSTKSGISSRQGHNLVTDCCQELD